MSTGTPELVKKLVIADGHESNVWSWRHLCDPNGGRINLRACVHHIPVIGQAPGFVDFNTLIRVLEDQGLMVQMATDGTGNVGLFTRPNRLCWQAKGGNNLTCGIEHMHFRITDPWSKRQMRAAGWIAQYLEREYGLPLRMADIDPAGPGVIKVVRTGHTSHQQIARMAGFNNRVDPGRGFDYEYMFHCAKFFKRHNHFKGA